METAVGDVVTRRSSELPKSPDEGCHQDVLWWVYRLESCCLGRKWTGRRVFSTEIARVLRIFSSFFLSFFRLFQEKTTLFSLVFRLFLHFFMTKFDKKIMSKNVEQICTLPQKYFRIPLLPFPRNLQRSVVLDLFSHSSFFFSFLFVFFGIFDCQCLLRIGASFVFSFIIIYLINSIPSFQGSIQNSFKKFFALL